MGFAGTFVVRRQSSGTIMLNGFSIRTPPHSHMLEDDLAAYPLFSSFLYSDMSRNRHRLSSHPNSHQCARHSCSQCPQPKPSQSNHLLPDITRSVIQHVLQLYSSQILKRRLDDSMMTGEQKVDEWLRRHSATMHSQLGVFPSTFVLVLQDLENFSHFAPTRYISIQVQLAIFLYIYLP